MVSGVHVRYTLLNFFPAIGGSLFKKRFQLKSFSKCYILSSRHCFISSLSILSVQPQVVKLKESCSFTENRKKNCTSCRLLALSCNINIFFFHFLRIERRIVHHVDCLPGAVRLIIILLISICQNFTSFRCNF
jgi:hypothetical protein